MDVTVILSWIGGALAWVRKPVEGARDKALQAAEQYSHVGAAAGAGSIEAARAALNDAASALRSISRGHPWRVRLYCWCVRYDLEAAASALIRLHNRIGDRGYDNKDRQFVRDAVYVFLRAHQHLTRERVDEIKRQAERDKRLSEAKF
jgi:hypothetical protein